MDILGIAGTILKTILNVPQTVAKALPQGMVRDRVAEGSTWSGAGVVGALVFLVPDMNLHQQWFIIVALALIGISNILKNETK